MSAAAVIPEIIEDVEIDASPSLVLVRPPQVDFARIVGLVLDSVSSPLTRRAYGDALKVFLVWFRDEWRAYAIREGIDPLFTRACVQHYKSTLETKELKGGGKLSPSSVNKALAAIRKLASEARYNDLLSNDTAGAIRDIKGAKRQGVRMGNWLSAEQAQALLELPDGNTLKGKRDRALLAVLLGAGLRRSEVANLTVEHLQQREGRWVIVDLLGKHGRVRSVPVANGIKAAIDRWTEAAQITEGRLFRAVNKGDRIVSDRISDQAVYGTLAGYAEQLGVVKLPPHDMRRTFAQLARKGNAVIEQIQLVLGHASIATTERYLGSKLDLDDSPSDHIRLKF